MWLTALPLIPVVQQRLYYQRGHVRAVFDSLELEPLVQVDGDSALELRRILLGGAFDESSAIRSWPARTDVPSLPAWVYATRSEILLCSTGSPSSVSAAARVRKDGGGGIGAVIT